MAVWLLKLKQAMGRLLTSTYYGFQLYALAKRVLARRREGAPYVSKETFEMLAKQALDEFIASDQQVSIPPAGETPDVSVVLVTFNQCHFTLQCLSALLKQTACTFELILIDNGSSDNTEVLLDRITNATIIRNTSNLGFIEAVNQGAQKASSEHLLLLNNDAILLADCLSNAHHVLRENKSCGAVGGRIILLSGRLQEAGSTILRDGSCAGIGRGAFPNSFQYMHRRTVDFCSGAFLLTKKEIWDSIGGFDRTFSPAYYEDVDYCVELRKRGFDVIYDPFSTLLHYEFGSSKNTESAVQLQKERRRVFVDKHQDYLRDKKYNRLRASPQGKSILYIDDRVPHPSLGAGYPRSYSMLEALHSLGFSVTLYPMQPLEECWSNIYCAFPRELEVAQPGGAIEISKFLAARTHYYDTVLISRDHNFKLAARSLLKSKVWKGKVNLIYDAEALVCERTILQHTISGHPLSERKQRRLRERELRLAKAATSIISVSNAEAQRFRKAGHRGVHVVGHRLRSSPTQASFDQRHGFLFVGALRDDDSPNVDSLLWFVKEVFPIVQRRLGSDVKLYVVGDASAPSLKRITDPTVVFMGRINNIDIMYEKCRVFVAPTRFAAGIPHKVHEAAAKGVPCVVTELLANQLDWTHQKQIMAADSPEQFASHCEVLYKEEAAWASIRTHANLAVTNECAPIAFRRSVEQIFSPENCTNSKEQCMGRG